MKIFLEAFIDNNFGDNLFVHILTSRYSEHTFYLKEKEEYKKSYEILEGQIQNIRIIRQEDEATYFRQMDGMLVVGGDMFGNGADYSNMIRQIKTIKKGKGFVGFLGISLFQNYSIRTWFDLSVLFSYADFVVVRESTTYHQLKKHVPWAKVICSCDMVFSVNLDELKKKRPDNNILGISVRKKIQAEEALYYPQYCNNVARAAVHYLEESPNHKVHFLAFSSGKYDDCKVAEDIMGLCPEELQKRMECISFHGNVETYMSGIQECGKLLCTRFHALVFAILLEKPFVPIIYEEKMARLLDEIGYYGKRLYYEDFSEYGKIPWCQSKGTYSRDKLSGYYKRAASFFEDADKRMK